MRRKPLAQSVPRPIVVPDVAGDLAAVRAGLPNFPVYDPPIATAVKPPPLVPDGVGDGYESAARTILCTDIPDPTAVPFLSVYATQRRWRAIDVFVATNFAGALGVPFLHFAIFAITRGVRTLVAQGRTRATPGHRVMSARVQCDRYEVVVGRSGAPLSAAQTATVTIVASDESEFTPADEPQVGAITAQIGASMQAGSGVVSVAGPLRPQFVAMHAINSNAADRWMMYFDAAAVPADGTAPVFQFYLPANGDGEKLVEAAVFRYTNFQNGLAFAASSTAGQLTQAVDVYNLMWFR